ncbi:hypothetical protein [Tropicimonas marinistellae]|uniref:hypothetical protein n=1 Tax=Tropicimonas marinistellae TaxID=1739787 RepID=UPI000836CAC0|nr:hypothetical protein [Tropicimonas marinistellae]
MAAPRSAWGSIGPPVSRPQESFVSYTVAANEPLTEGTRETRFEFAYDGGRAGNGGDGALYVDDIPPATGRIDRTQPTIFSPDETADVGIDLAIAVVEEIGAEAESRFTGRVVAVKVEVE